MLIPIFQRGHSHQLFKFAGEIIAVRITASDGNFRYRKICAAKKPGGRTDAKGVEIFQGAGAVNIVEYPAEMTGGHTGHGGKILNRDIFTEWYSIYAAVLARDTVLSFGSRRSSLAIRAREVII